ncbi:GNAT family N-acetyltransferase [Streptomyces sp. TRM 70351]|uniref:GNAT family N-acetyltransferase n=1 Tax=Streptomyces sp. TRM 70351 TaxID=3116552 RepID=UPI002E7C0FBF|nr:GNAT family N-acetyltransferase [Streptomyces sp. TRM 70351]MEE1931008.1 GNAT family N-acetyltransferase [Streptomyces sp. TRM 70351]
MEPNDLTVRPLTGRDELDLFNQLPYVLNGQLADDLDRGRRRPGWMWVALRRGRVLARAAWWSRPGADDTPFLMDVLDLDDGLPVAERVDVGTRLLRAAMAAALPEGERPPEFCRFVPPGWRDDTAVREGVESRTAVLERLGARLFVERLRLEWRPGAPLPAPSGRLAFRPVRGAEELLPLLTSVLEGTLDAHGRDDLTRMTAREAAVGQWEEEFRNYTTPREWWRVATLPGGEPVGFVLPARNAYNPIIAYIGVLPGHRGNGYIDDLLAEGTRVLAGQGAERVRASTDLGNTPMANAFRRNGYVAFEHEIDMTWG